MKLLLDTHTFIWFVYNAAELPDKTRELLEDDQRKPQTLSPIKWPKMRSNYFQSRCHISI